MPAVRPARVGTTQESPSPPHTPQNKHGTGQRLGRWLAAAACHRCLIRHRPCDGARRRRRHCRLSCRARGGRSAGRFVFGRSPRGLREPRTQAKASLV